MSPQKFSPATTAIVPVDVAGTDGLEHAARTKLPTTNATNILTLILKTILSIRVK